jgi:hypothetical protein
MYSALLNTGLPIVLSPVTHKYIRIILTINAVSAKGCIIKKPLEVVNINLSLVKSITSKFKGQEGMLLRAVCY